MVVCPGHRSSYLSGSGVHAGKVDAGNELNGRRSIGVLRSTMDVHAVYAVLMDTLVVI